MGRKNLSLAATLLLFVALLPNPATGQADGRPVEGEAKTAFLKAWGERLDNMHTLHMVFTQEKHFPLLRQPLTTQGELWLKGKTLYYVLKNTDGTPDMQLRVDERTVKTYYPQLNTLEIIELNTEQPPPLSLPFLGRDIDRLEKTYKIDLIATDKQYIVQLTPRNPASSVRDLHLTLQDFQPIHFSQTEKNGNRLAMHITTFASGINLDEDQLELYVPAGTTITYPLK